MYVLLGAKLSSRSLRYSEGVVNGQTKVKNRRRAVHFSRWEAKDSAHTEAAASASKRNEKSLPLESRGLSETATTFPQSVSFACVLLSSWQMQRNQNAVGPVCARLCESVLVYLTCQLAVMTHGRLYHWQKSSLFSPATPARRGSS